MPNDNFSSDATAQIAGQSDASQDLVQAGGQGNDSFQNQKMSKEEMIDKIIELVESIKVTRKKTEEIKKQVLEKMHELERLQKKREVKEVEQEMDQMLA